MDTFWTIAAICGAILAIVGVVTVAKTMVAWGKRRYRRSRKGIYMALNRLGPGVQLEHFNSVLGMAPRIRSGNGHIYVHPWFYVQAVTNDSGTVAMYAVTTRDPSFAPPVWGPYGLKGEHQLGRATYKQLIMEGIHTGAMAWRTNRRYYYMESVGSGNWNAHLTLIVGLNDAGAHFDSVNPDNESDPTGPSDALPEELCSSFECVRLGDLDLPHAENEQDMRSLHYVEAYFQHERVRRWRRRNVPNSYAVAGPLESPSMVSHIGPDLDTVRVLPRGNGTAA